MTDLGLWRFKFQVSMSILFELRIWPWNTNWIPFGVDQTWGRTRSVDLLELLLIRAVSSTDLSILLQIWDYQSALVALSQQVLAFCFIHHAWGIPAGVVANVALCTRQLHVHALYYLAGIHCNCAPKFSRLHPLLARLASEALGKHSNLHNAMYSNESYIWNCFVNTQARQSDQITGTHNITSSRQMYFDVTCITIMSTCILLHVAYNISDNITMIALHKLASSDNGLWVLATMLSTLQIFHTCWMSTRQAQLQLCTASIL